MTLSHLHPQDLREKNWKAMEAVASAERACEEKLRSLTQAKVSVSTTLASVNLLSRPHKTHKSSKAVRLQP